ncbi:hemicentin-1-like isoform 1-T1 [Synchiropus picturatus]
MMELELLFVGFLLSVTDASCPITLDPPTVVVKYGAPAKIICFATDSDYVQIGWEAPVGGTSPHPISSTPNLEWFVPNVTEWRLAPECYINPPRGSPKKQCSKKARVVVYDVPEEIRLDSDVTSDLAEGRLMLFTCSLNSSVPLTNLTISLYVNDNRTMMPDLKASRHVEAPFHIQASREMNGATVRCGAQVDLQPEVPLISLFSNEIFLNVLYEPVLTCPHNVSIPENAPYNLTCTAEGNPQPQIIWFKDGEEVDLPENLTRGDAGQYLVLASNAFNRTAAATVNIIVTYPPSQILELEDSEVEVGSSVRLKCASKAIPRPGYSWTYYQAENVMVVYEDGVSLLLVENATDFNAGVYTCHTGNIGGSVSKSVKLTVKGAQQECPLEILPEKLVVRYKERGHRVTCKPTTSGSINLKTLSWEVLPGDRTLGSDWLPDLYEHWELKPACHASFTGFGTCSKYLNLTLYKTPDSVSISSMLTNSTAGLTLITLTCDITNVAPAKNLVVHWYQGNGTLRPSHMAGGVTLSMAGCEWNTSAECNTDTIITPVNVSATVQLHLDQMRNLAEIRCAALLDLDVSNPPEAMMSDPLNVSVYYKPIINTTKLPKTIPVFQGYPEYLVCEADGNPPPKIQWTYSSDKVVQVSGGKIRVSEPGIYNCSASNVLDSTYHLVHVILKEDYLPLIAGLVAVTVVVISIIFIFIYSIYYTNTKMRHYNLKNPKLNSHNGNVAHNGLDLPLPMTKLS